MHKAAQKYLATQVTTTDQGQLLLMLYDAALKFLNQAKVKIDEKNYAQKGILLAKALDIFAELGSSLNKDKGGELAEGLSNLYHYCNARLLVANLKMDKSVIDEVIKIISGLRDAYAQIIKEGAAAPIPTLDRASAQATPRASFGAPRIPEARPATPPPVMFPLGGKAAQDTALKPTPSSAAPTAASTSSGPTTPETAQPQSTVNASQVQGDNGKATPSPASRPTEPSDALRRRAAQAYVSTPK